MSNIFYIVCFIASGIFCFAITSEITLKMSSPVGKTSLARCWPYGGSTAVNVLPQYLGTPDIVTHVSFSIFCLQICNKMPN